MLLNIYFNVLIYFQIKLFLVNSVKKTVILGWNLGCINNTKIIFHNHL